jgi:hypothetical protein
MQFEKCFAMQVDLEFPGIFAVSASSGMREPDHHYVKSLKVWNSAEEVLNSHF